ncbi:MULTISPECIES: hypothetical protein [unclassified Rahnella]|uniref:hypothetical protein n=1 Tax=Rahnella TaxID=34037 RepID=UPI000DC26E07|nr:MULTISPECIES: hypothetical protein [unclassified Rahnella]MDP9703243.1 hypothetical protein [Rahnella aquatilis]MQB53418.1 hypothetical protein [Rahnella sp. RcJ3]
MMGCNGNVAFGNESRKTIQVIRKQFELYNLGRYLLTSGVMYSIFVKNGALASSYYINQTDFVSFFHSAEAFDQYAKNQIYLSINRQLIFSTTHGTEHAFWKCMEKTFK